MNRLEPTVLYNLSRKIRYLISLMSIVKFTKQEEQQRNAWGTYEANTYLTDLDVSVLYGVRVTFDQLFHLPQVGLLDLLELLFAQDAAR